MIGFGQEKENEFQFEDRPKDYEYLSAPDSNGVRRHLKIPSTNKAVLKLPYPIIFIHGLTSNSATWNSTTDWMDLHYNLNFGGRFDICLNRDGNNSTANLNWWPFIGADLSLFQFSNSAGDYYYINFDVGVNGSVFPATDVKSNQSAIVKQGEAVSRVIKEVLQLTGRDKVILMGHSMGGLAAREYLQNPSIWQSDGLSHVAKLITTGTPHGGSDAPTFGLFADCQSEAYRDLRTSYNTGYPGVYLEGGLESDAIMDVNLCSDFYNFDVNCSGLVGATITGLNNKAINYSTIEHACIIGQCSSCLGGVELPGDGVVNESKANIKNYYPNMAVNLFYYTASDNVEIHTDLPKQNYQNMQGLDEPNELHYAYNIDFNTLYTGMVTMQPTGGYPYDYDDYKFDLPASGDVYVSISGIYNQPDLRARIYDGSSTASSYIQIGNDHSNYGSSNFSFTQNLSAGSYYLEIQSEPTLTSYYDTYKFYLNSSSTTDLGEYTISTKKLLKLVDVLGRETKQTNQPLFYIYDDGTVEKRIVIE